MAIALGRNTGNMKSIKDRLTYNFLLIIILTVVFLEALLIYTIRENYYRNLEENLFSQIKISAELYNRYFSDQSLSDNVMNNVDTFWKQSNCEVQILDTNGFVLMDSIGVIVDRQNKFEDVKVALNGGKGKWIGYVNYDESQVLSVAYPLRSGKKIVGVLRFITSLKDVNREIRNILMVFVFIGIIVIFISGAISILLANTIVHPLKKITKEALDIASGDFTIKCSKENEDEIGKLSDTLNYMTTEIVKKEQIKNEFICSVSHELRTPLTSIKGWAVTLKEMGFEDKKTMLEGLDIIEKESDRLSEMVEELLDFSKFVSGKITLKRESVDIKNVIEVIISQMSPRANKEGIKITAAFENEIPFIVSDENRLKQIFINVLDNAIRFTEPGGFIKISVYSTEKNMHVSIKDSGVGISEEDLPKIKEKFYKGKSSKSKNGIGLSVCDEIVSLMGGELIIESKEGEGTDVKFTIPIENN